MPYASLLKVLEGYHAARVLILGDVMLDRYVYGVVERISPEAPIAVMAIERTADLPGGAGNVARNLAALGAQACLIGVVGEDACAEILEAQLLEIANAKGRLIRDRSRPTSVKTRYVADGQQIFRADRESRAPLSAEIEKSVLAEYCNSLSQADVVILSDYAKGVLTDSVVSIAMSEARAHRKIVIVDPKDRSFAKYRGATVLTPNRSELELACGVPCRTDEEIVIASRRTLETGICEAVLVTRGKDGMSVVAMGAAATHMRTAARQVFDVSGAGDTVVAALSLGLAAGGGLNDSAALANVAAGIVVGKRGTAVATAGEIIGALRHNDAQGEPRKIFSLEIATQLASEWRREGMKVAFTNGCFDLLHPGHLSLLDQARQTADRLIVGLNSDQSATRLKGPGRPVQGEAARATVLASLKSVDAVVIFGEDTPLQLIEALAPDVLVKGADYTEDTIVGADLVKRRGGAVVLATLLEGYSTTSTVERVASAKIE